MMPRRSWRAATRAMADADVALAMTTRSLRGPASCPLVIDHVDALSLNMARRARGDDESVAVRAFARFEALRFRSWERRCAGWSAAAVATSAEDAGALPAQPRVEVIPVGLDHVDEAWAASQRRPIDVVLSGNMRYPPNRRAALMLDREIVPALRARLQGVRVVVAGRAADALALRNVEVMSDVPDMLAVLCASKVAIAPLELGTGSPYKVLEAAACGAAVVSSPWAAARFGLAALTAGDAAGYCDALHELLADPARRAALVADSQEAVRLHDSALLARRLEQLLVAATGG
jgi:glycosyltransferase involved in cell wall biosynthesis